MTQRQTALINFGQGLDTKTDPWQVQIGKFESLQNSIFQKGGLLSKRNGYGLLYQQGGPIFAPAPPSSYITTFNDNLVSIGSRVNAYSTSINDWVKKGTLQPCSLKVLPLIRNNINQVQCDAVTANGLVLTTYTQTTTSTSAVTTSYLFAIADETTGQNITAPAAIPALNTSTISGSSRVFVVGSYFVIVSETIISATSYLQYVSIPINNPVNTVTGAARVSAAQNVTAEAYIPISSNPGWDAVVVDDALVVAYNSAAGAQGIHVTSLTEAQIIVASASSLIQTFNNAAYVGAIVSVCADASVSPNIIYISFWNNSTQDGYTCAVYIGFGTITTKFTPQKIISVVAVANLASAAINNACYVFSEVTNAYSYDSSIPSNYINGVTVSSSGSVGTPYVAIRSVGLASKAFAKFKTEIIVGDIGTDVTSVFFLAAFKSPFQPSYFLVDGARSTSAAPIIIAKLAYQNGVGYVTRGLPGVVVNDYIAQISYLFKDNVQALNTLNTPQQTTTGGVYSQLGVNLVTFDLATMAIDSVEIANNLHISGGFLAHFDGYLPVEHNFFVWPDSVELTYNATSTVTPTGTFTSGSTTVTVSSATGISPGMIISDTSNATYIPTGTIVVTVNGTTLTISQATTHAGTGDNLSIHGSIEAVPTGGAAGSGAYYYQVTYEWTDNQGQAYRSTPSIPVTYVTTGAGTTGSVIVNVPTLRLTYKISNPVKIVIYRWSQFTQVYNQVTSITAPVLNSTTTDSISFVDNLADASIVGNNIIYTTGGVKPNVNGPSTDILSVFDTRVWSVDNEDPNTVLVSKQAVEGEPIDLSLTFRIYIAPNTGTVGTTGPVKAMAPMDDKMILFKKDSIYYINGVGPDNLGSTSNGCSLGNYSQPIFVTSVVGCVNQKSIVLTSDGLMFQSDKGIWLLSRGLGASYVGAPVEAFNSSLVTSAKVIPETNYVLFTLDTGEMLMYDYYYQQWGTFVGARAVSSCIYNGLHTILTPELKVLQETPGQYLDDSTPVVMSFTTNWINLASLQGYERFYNFYILAKYLSPHKINCQIGYNYNPSILHQAVISPKNFSPSASSPFGVPTPFGSPGNKEQWKIDAKMQLCESFQLTLTEVYDASFGIAPGAGLTISGLSCNLGLKKSTRPIPGARSAGFR